MSRLGDAALAYVEELGWRVHPLWPNAKEPLLPNGVHGASSDPATVAAWWRRWPDANIGVATGTGSIDVLDIDAKGAANGPELAARARSAGLLSGWTAVLSTPSGGTHIWFPPADQGGGAIGRKRALELKANGGYVLLPPSFVHAETYEGTYRVTARRDSGHPIDWAAVKALLDPPKPLAAPTVFRPDGAAVNFDGLIRHVAAQGPESGNRNNALFWAACRAVEGGAGADVFRDLVAAAVANGLPERGAWATVNSARRTARTLVTA